MSNLIGQQIRQLRRQRGWSQARLASDAGVSRTLVSAIEQGRLTPSVTAALGLARALNTTVEALFARPNTGACDNAQDAPPWAWTPTLSPASEGGAVRFWAADVAGRRWWYPAEATGVGTLPHHGLWSDGRARRCDVGSANDVLVIATCDPAVGVLAREYARQTRFQLLPLVRSSRAALQWLAEGKVHAAGVHLASSREVHGNAPAVRKQCDSGVRLLRVGDWQEGVAFAPRIKLASVRAATRGKTRWVGREPGSGARVCLDRLLDGRNAPRRIASDHRGVAAAIKAGWADAGVCLKLASEEAGLGFLEVQREPYDLCFAESYADDPRLRALVEVVQSSSFRRILDELPGYDSRTTGSLASC